MSIRIGLYDFFAFTLPGAFYLVVVTFGLASFKLINITFSLLNNMSSTSLLLLLGASYLLGLLLDPIAHKWVRLFRGRNSETRKSAFEEFQRQYQWLNLNFKYTDWAILLRILKNNSVELSADIEQHNVASIMLRNISFGLLVLSIIYIIYFFLIVFYVWNLILAGVSIALSFVAMNRSIQRRRWFYLGIFETITAQQLLQEKWVVDNRQQDSKHVEPSKLEIAEKQPASPKAQTKSKK